MILLWQIPLLQNMLVLPIFGFYCFLVYKRLRREHASRFLLSVMASMLFFAFFSGRLWYAIFEGDSFTAWYDFFNPMIDGWVSWGVLLGGAFGIAIITWTRKGMTQEQLLNILDAFALYAPIFTALYYTTSVFHGSGVGIPTDVPWAITYPGWPSSYHPTHIYTILSMIPIFLFLRRQKPRQPGELMGYFVLLFCGSRFLIDFLRWYPDYLYHYGLVLSQWVCIALCTSVIVSHLMKRPKKHTRPQSLVR
ncbi:prolipoprotein diacylglyceryl transferase [Candidatus Woesearchaeota archaeon]|nr:prolipoprotein diacylglyceryl transferase [Candidatus Woesearchaeota archaeon]